MKVELPDISQPSQKIPKHFTCNQLSFHMNEFGFFEATNPGPCKAKILTNDNKRDTEDLNSGANQSREQLGALRRPKHIAMDQLPTSLL